MNKNERKNELKKIVELTGELTSIGLKDPVPAKREEKVVRVPIFYLSRDLGKTVETPVTLRQIEGVVLTLLKLVQDSELVDGKIVEIVYLKGYKKANNYQVRVRRKLERGETVIVDDIYDEGVRGNGKATSKYCLCYSGPPRRRHFPKTPSGQPKRDLDGIAPPNPFKILLYYRGRRLFFQDDKG